MSIAFSVDGNAKVITVTGDYTGSLADALTGAGYDASVSGIGLKIIGSGTGAIWNDFQFSYSGPEGRPATLHLENITFLTTTIDGYCVYSRDTTTTMKDVTFDGYSGGQGRWTETGGGAMRIRAATYTGQSSSSPSLENVTVQNCCRGFRVQDTTGIYVKNCHAVKATGATYSVSDNAFYFAAGNYKSTTGCTGCTFDNCDATDVGQTGFQNIGGDNNTFKDCSINGSIGAGFSCYNTNGTINVTGCTFTNANTHTAGETSGWGGGVDNYDGAACGMSVEAGDTSAICNVTGCTFVSGGSIVYYVTGPGKMERSNNNITLAGFPNGLGAGYISYSTDSNGFMVITVTGSYTGLLTAVLSANGYNPTPGLSVPLKIVGDLSITSLTAVWNDFQFSYTTQGFPLVLRLEDITLLTTTINGFCVLSVATQVSMKNVVIDGYSGGQGRWTETAGGAMGIVDTDYIGHNSASPTLQNVTVKNCCRGFCFYGAKNAYIKDCSCVKATGASYSVADNGFYFSASSTRTGSEHCTFDNCDATDVGQCGLLNIGGSNNTFKDCSINGSIGAGIGCYNAIGTINVSGCTFTNANTHTAGETSGWGGGVDNFDGAACGLNVDETGINAVLNVTGCSFVSGGGHVFYASGPGVVKRSNNNVTLAGFPNGVLGPASAVVSDDGIVKVITVKGFYNGSLADALASSGYNPANNWLRIVGDSLSIWNNFQFSYSGPEGRPAKLHLDNINFLTTTINGYCVYSRDTATTMRNVTFDGYSGGQGRWTEIGGGAMRIRAATYTEQSSSSPSLENVTVQNCCRGFRVQDTTGIYVKNCHAVKATGATYSVSDNAFYFASGSYTSAMGCTDCTFDTCDATDVGQTGFQNIGGDNNTFKDCSIDGSIGAGFSCYNTNGTINVTGCTFTNANTHTAGETSGWGGGVDNYGGAACGMSVEAGDTSGLTNVSGCTFVSGGGSVYYISGPGVMDRLSGDANIVNIFGFPNGWGVSSGNGLTANCFPEGTPVETDQGEVAIENLASKKYTIRGKEVVAITQTTPLQSHLIRFDKGSLGKNVPSVATTVSKEHRILYQGKMTKARDFVTTCQGVSQVPYNGELLYNVLLKKEGKMIVNNMICETLNPNDVLAKISTMEDTVEQEKALFQMNKLILDKHSNNCNKARA